MPKSEEPPKGATLPPPNELKPPAAPVTSTAPGAAAPAALATVTPKADEPAPAAERRATEPPKTKKASGDPRPWINPKARWQDYKPWRS